MLEIPHEVDPSPVDEIRGSDESPITFAERMARTKAMDRAVHHPQRWVLGADTVVVVEGEMLGKPDSAGEAEQMLMRLSGRRHEVVSAAALVRDGTVYHDRDVSRVWFRKLESETIRRYVATGEPLDKAGAYGIQGKGAVLIDRIEGDFFGVMGLSLRVLTELLERAGTPYRFTR
jgi:septum formation protein